MVIRRGCICRLDMGADKYEITFGDGLWEPASSGTRSHEGAAFEPVVLRHGTGSAPQIRVPMDRTIEVDGFSRRKPQSRDPWRENAG